MNDLILILFAVIAALLLRVFVLSLARVKGSSMLPALHDGDWLFVWRLPYLFRRPRRFDVVICHFPGRRVRRIPFLPQSFVKRVVGLPGETLEVIDVVLHVDGAPLEEPFLAPERTRFFRNRPPVTLGPDAYYVLGDNRDASNDSRRVGPLRRRAIRGRVLCRIWPPRRIGPLR